LHYLNLRAATFIRVLDRLECTILLLNFCAPKVENLKALFPALWRDKPVLVAEAGKGN